MDVVLIPEKRPRGRPPTRCDADTRRLLGTAAAAEFARHGYAGASVAAVAKTAGVSTRTMYRLVPTKADLFELSMGDRIDEFLLAVDENKLAGLGIDEALAQILSAFAALVLSPQTIATSRLLYAESERFPEIAGRYHEAAVSRVDGAIARWLSRQERNGHLVLPDGSASASGFLRGMMIGDAQRAVLLRREQPPDAPAIERRARACARLFLDGCRA